MSWRVPVWSCSSGTNWNDRTSVIPPCGKRRKTDSPRCVNQEKRFLCALAQVLVQIFRWQTSHGIRDRCLKVAGILLSIRVWHSHTGTKRQRVSFPAALPLAAGGQTPVSNRRYAIRMRNKHEDQPLRHGANGNFRALWKRGGFRDCRQGCTVETNCVSKTVPPCCSGFPSLHRSGRSPRSCRHLPRLRCW